MVRSVRRVVSLIRMVCISIRCSPRGGTPAEEEEEVLDDGVGWSSSAIGVFSGEGDSS